MAKSKELEQPVVADTKRHVALNAVIEKQVMHALGRPAHLQRIQVRELWDDRYRVNVFVGQDITSAILAHSFFLVIDDAGSIVTATPGIRKLYESTAGERI